MQPYPIIGMATGVNPESLSQCNVMFNFVLPNPCDATGVKLHWRLTFLWTTSVVWRGETYCMGNRRSLMKTFPVLGFGEDDEKSLLCDGKKKWKKHLLMEGFCTPFCMGSWSPTRGQEDDLVFSARTSAKRH